MTSADVAAAALAHAEALDGTPKSSADLLHAMRKALEAGGPARAVGEAYAVAHHEWAAEERRQEERRKAEADPFPWMEFLAIRRRCIVGLREQGKSFAEIARTLSLHDADHAQRIYDARDVPA